MQKPLVALGMAWWSPPLMLLARLASPSQTLRAASTVAMTTVAVIACIAGKIGLSVVPSPYAGFGRPA